jgi:hypothetical protein
LIGPAARIHRFLHCILIFLFVARLSRISPALKGNRLRPLGFCITAAPYRSPTGGCAAALFGGRATAPLVMTPRQAASASLFTEPAESYPAAI